MDQNLAQVQTILRTTPARWINLIEAVPLELMTQPPIPGEWSAIECLLHLVDAEREVFPVRVRAMLNGQDFPGFNPDKQGTKLTPDLSPANLASEFARLRKESLDMISPLSPEDLEKKARHSQLGMVTMREMMNEWATHDLNHTVQAERALMQPFIRGCGPWVVYFQDHIPHAK